MKTTQPRKQRKRMYNMPTHLRHNLVGSHLSVDLKKRYGTRAVPVRQGDKVKIMRGTFKGKEGKVIRVNLDRYKAYVDGITRSKTEGTKVFVPIHPSKLMIIDLDTTDKMRVESLKRKGKNAVVETKVEKAPAKPSAPAKGESKPTKNEVKK